MKQCVQSQSVRSWVWKDGKFQERAFIPVDDRGFRYGMSVFETLAIVCGRAVLSMEHLRRLELAAVQFEFPIDRSALRGLSVFLERPPLKEGLLRIHWTAGDGGPADPFLRGRLIVRSEEMPLPGSLAPMQKLSLVGIEANLSEWEGWKTGNYMLRCRLLARARKGGADEVLLAQSSGLLAGAAMANVFLVSDSGQLVTPQIQSGVRNGTVREWLIQHYDVEERDVTFQEAISAKEILLTNSRLGVASVRSLEERSLEEGEVFRRVGNSYRGFLLSHVRSP